MTTMARRRPGPDGASRRRLALVSFAAVGALGACYVALTALVWGTTGRNDLDRAAFRVVGKAEVNSLVGGRSALRSHVRPADIVELGSSKVVIPLACALALVALVWRDRVGAVVAVAGPGATGVLTEYVAKPLINMSDRTGVRAFPSGHAGATAAVALAILVVVWRRWGPLWALIAAPFVVVPTLLADAALLSLGYHAPTDVLGGALLAAVIVLGLTATLSLYAGPGSQILRPRPRAPSDESIIR